MTQGDRDLIERLRAYRPRDGWGDGCRHFICDEAADRLEARLDEVERYRAALGRIAQRDIAGLAEYTPQAMVAIASQALKGANNG